VTSDSRGTLVPRSQWSFASCPSGPPGTPSVTDICLAGGFQNNRVYELRYRATVRPENPIATSNGTVRGRVGHRW
jgi:hypothetical protein